MPRKRSRHLIGGYIWNAAMARAQCANDRTRDALANLHEHLTTTPDTDEINVLLLSQLLTDAALAVADSAAALNELKAIADAQLSQERTRK